MAIKSTVAIDKKIHQKIKKLALLLGLNQGDIVKRAIILLEADSLQAYNSPHRNSKKTTDEEKLDQIYAKARTEVWKKYPKRKEIQELAEKSDIQIDDLIFSDWETGLE